MEQSKERKKIVERIKLFEKQARFNEDVEDDAPAQIIKPKDVDYADEKLSSKILTKMANLLGIVFFESMIKKKKFICNYVKFCYII